MILATAMAIFFVKALAAVIIFMMPVLIIRKLLI